MTTPAPPNRRRRPHPAHGARLVVGLTSTTVALGLTGGMRLSSAGAASTTHNTATVVTSSADSSSSNSYSTFGDDSWSDDTTSDDGSTATGSTGSITATPAVPAPQPD